MILNSNAIYHEEVENSRAMFKQCVDEEKAWAQYLFKDGSMIGLSEKLALQLCGVDCKPSHESNRSLKPLYDVPASNNPLPWTSHWLQSKGVQVAPQETEVESYVIGGIKQDIKDDAFTGFKL